MPEAFECIIKIIKLKGTLALTFDPRNLMTISTLQFFKLWMCLIYRVSALNPVLDDYLGGGGTASDKENSTSPPSVATVKRPARSNGGSGGAKKRKKRPSEASSNNDSSSSSSGGKNLQKQKTISSRDEIPHNSKVSKNQNSWIFLT